MKATLDISEDVLTRARKLAARESVPFDHLTEEGLRWVLERREQRGSAPVKPVVGGGRGLRPGLPEDFIDNIRDWAYDEEPPN